MTITVKAKMSVSYITRSEKSDEWEIEVEDNATQEEIETAKYESARQWADEYIEVWTE